MNQPDRTGISASGNDSSDDQRLLIAVDVDGTLLNTEFEDQLRERELDALAAVRRAGHVVALVTGRNSRSVEALLARSGDGLGDLPLVLLNGAVVWGGDPRRRLSHQVMTRDTLHRIVTIFRHHGAMAMVYDTEDRGGLLWHEDRQANSVLSRYLAKRRQAVGAIEVVDDLLANLPDSALEVGTIDEHDRIKVLSEEIRRELGDRVKVINTQSLLSRGAYSWAEIYHPDCSKGQGTLMLAGELGIPATNIIAVGDNFNDLEMFAVAAHSIAMGNAPDVVKAAADSVAPPVAEHGAAVVLERIAAGHIPGRDT